MNSCNIPESTNGEEDRHAGNEVENEEDEFCTRWLGLWRVMRYVTLRGTTLTYPEAALHRLNGPLGDHRQVVGTRDVDKEEKPYEMRIVVVANAVVDPWTMVVLLGHATTTPATMP